MKNSYTFPMPHAFVGKSIRLSVPLHLSVNIEALTCLLTSTCFAGMTIHQQDCTLGELMNSIYHPGYEEYPTIT